MIMLTMRQNDLSCVYMYKSGRIHVDLKCIVYRKQWCSQTAKYSNIVIHSISECPIAKYHSDIHQIGGLGQTETLGEDGTIIRTVGKARPGPES